MECVCDAEDNRMRREFGGQKIAKERLSVIYTFR